MCILTVQTELWGLLWSNIWGVAIPDHSLCTHSYLQSSLYTLVCLQLFLARYKRILQQNLCYGHSKLSWTWLPASLHTFQMFSDSMGFFCDEHLHRHPGMFVSMISYLFLTLPLNCGWYLVLLNITLTALIWSHPMTTAAWNINVCNVI